jgi:phosphoribosylformylglycinamidine synthase
MPAKRKSRGEDAAAAAPTGKGSKAATLEHYYSTQGLEKGAMAALIGKAHEASVPVTGLETEFCFNVSCETALSKKERDLVKWCLTETGYKLSDKSTLSASGHEFIVEVGPRMNFCTAWSTNCVSVLQAAEVSNISRVERSRRFKVLSKDKLSAEEKATFVALIHDRMTEMVYEKAITTFDSGLKAKPVKWVPVLKEGRKALEKINEELGLGTPPPTPPPVRGIDPGSRCALHAEIPRGWCLTERNGGRVR